jgi:hypothetical protein
VNGVVLISMLGTGVLVIGNDIKNKGGIHGTHLLGLGIVYIGLTAMNQVSPKLAIPFSILVFVAVALATGPSLLTSIGNYTSSNTKLPGYKQDPSTFVPGAVVPPKKSVRSTGPSGIGG